MNQTRKRAGFTIVELLIVIVVIAILAAIALVGYNGIQNQARAAAARSAASQAVKKITTWSLQNNEDYPETLAQLGIVESAETDYQYSANNMTDPKSFCLAVIASGVGYWASSTHLTPTSGNCQVTNLVTNPSFETNTTDWVENGGRLIERSTEWSADGSASLRITNNSASVTNLLPRVGNSVQAFTPTEPGAVFTVSATVLPANYGGAGAQFRIRLDWVDSSGTLITHTSTETPVAQGTERRLVQTGTAPAGTIFVRASVWASSVPVGGYFYLDSVMLTRGVTHHTFADGSTSGWSWSGTPHNSTSSGPAL